MDDLPKLPANVKLFTADATAMYTNIDTEAALEAFNFLFDYYKEEIPSDFPRTLFLAVLEIVMKQNFKLMTPTGSKRMELPWERQPFAFKPP